MHFLHSTLLLYDLVSVCMCQLSEQNRSVCEELHTVKEKLDKEMEQEKMVQREKDQLQREKERLEAQVHSVGRANEDVIQDREDLR